MSLVKSIQKDREFLSRKEALKRHLINVEIPTRNALMVQVQDFQNMLDELEEIIDYLVIGEEIHSGDVLVLSKSLSYASSNLSNVEEILANAIKTIRS